MICPDCGQTLPEGGVCYNCQKNIIDAKRYGRGSGIIPAYRKYGPQGSATRNIDRGPRKKSPARRKKTGRIEGSRKGVRSKRRSTLKRQKFPKRVRSQPVWKAPLPKWPLRGKSLSRLRSGVNEFLKAVYQQPLLISDVLKRQGFSDRQITALKGEVANYLAFLLTTLYNRWQSILTSRQLLVITQYYCFNGQLPQEKKFLAKKLGIPIESFTDDLNEAITKLRQPHHKRHIDRTISDTAKRVLRNSGTL